MNRRRFLEALGIMSAAFATGRAYGDSDYTLTSTPMGVSAQRLRAARAVVLGSVNYTRPATLPKVINLYLYGGPSELAGNLTNITEINSISVNKYPAALLTGGLTRNNFWAAAGGNDMEAMLAAGQMSLYRTMNRVIDDNKAHGRSITQNQYGSPDVASAGMATKLAAVLAANSAVDANKVFLPFVSFEGSSRFYNPGDNPLPVPFGLKHITLSANPSADNAFARAANSDLPLGADNDAIEALANSVATTSGAQYNEMNRSFSNRAKLADFIATTFNATTINNALPVDPATGAKIVYPNNVFGDSLKSAISLAIMNPDTLFISVNGGGVGWDDHNISLTNYPPRIASLMAALRVAANHLALAKRNDIIINVFGDFGRNADINDSLGWDHGNNQNFYTLGGSDFRVAGALGKLVGTTAVLNAGGNRVFTTPASGSYQFEPFAIAASMYKYFGVQNPEVLTEGVPVIDETVASTLI